MCDIIDRFQKGEIVPNVKRYIKASKRRETAQGISKILEDNDNVVISESNQDKIKKLISEMKR